MPEPGLRWEWLGRVPADGHRFGFPAYILCGDGYFDRRAGQRDGEVEIGLREPVAAEIACVNDTCYRLAVGCVADVEVFGFGLVDGAVDGEFAHKVVGQVDGVAAPIGGDGLAVCGDSAPDAARKRHEKGRAEGVVEVALTSSPVPFRTRAAWSTEGDLSRLTSPCPGRLAVS